MSRPIHFWIFQKNRWEAFIPRNKKELETLTKLARGYDARYDCFVGGWEVPFFVEYL